MEDVIGSRKSRSLPARFDSRPGPTMPAEAGALRLVGNDWGSFFASAFARGPHQVRIVCPFITRDALERLLDEHVPSDLRVLTRFSLADFSRGVSDIGALRAVLIAGGRVRGVRHLHAKLYIFDASSAAITSANLTMAALHRNHEFGCVVFRDAEVGQCRSYFKHLWKRSGKDLTLAQLDEWETLLEQHLSAGAPPASEAELPDFGSRVDDAQHEPVIQNVGWVAEAGNAHIKFFGTNTERVDHHFQIFSEIERAGCHWACGYPRGKRPRKVGEGDIMFMGRLAKRPADTLIFGRAVTRAHVDARDDASPAEVLQRGWKATWPHYIRVHHAEFIAGTMANGVSMREMLDILGPHAFRSTQERLQAGELNPNPHRSVGQQPAVRLSSEGFEWLRDRFQQHVDRHGAIPNAALEQLDWPTVAAP